MLGRSDLTKSNAHMFLVVGCRYHRNLGAVAGWPAVLELTNVFLATLHGMHEMLYARSLRATGNVPNPCKPVNWSCSYSRLIH